MRFFMNGLLMTDCVAGKLNFHWDNSATCVPVYLWPQMQMLQTETQATAAHTRHMPFPSASVANDASAECSTNERDLALQRENARTCRRANAPSATWIVTQTDARALLSLCVLLGALDIFMCSPPTPPPPPFPLEEASRCCRAGAVARSAMFSDCCEKQFIGQPHN